VVIVILIAIIMVAPVIHTATKRIAIIEILLGIGTGLRWTSKPVYMPPSINDILTTQEKCT